MFEEPNGKCQRHSRLLSLGILVCEDREFVSNCSFVSLTLHLCLEDCMARRAFACFLVKVKDDFVVNGECSHEVLNFPSLILKGKATGGGVPDRKSVV